MNYRIQALLVAFAVLFISDAAAQVTTFAFTGAVQTYTVPAGVTNIQIECWGAQGGTGTGFDGVEGTGGLGGYAIGELAVTPGQVLEVYVGGAGAMFGPGGFNGGGQAGTNYGAAGGGASDVRTGAYALGDRVIVGGGGGGGTFGSYGHFGGEGGGLVGGMGDSGDGFTAGSGGTQVAGGAAGCCYGAASAGTFGLGAGPGDYHNAGGGGGWYGGGSGAGHAGAGGGSSYIAGVVAGSTTPGLRTGDGEVVITVLCTSLTVTVSSDEVCLGEEVTLDATSDSGALVTWDGGITNGVPFTPSLGTTTYTATSADPDDCEYTIDIVVNDTPSVTITVDAAEICDGETVTFTEGGDADTYVWDPVDVVDGVPYTPAGLGTTTYTLTGTITATGCTGMTTTDVTVHALPTVTAAADFTEICLGEEVTFTGGGADTYTWDMGVTDGVPFTPGGTGTVTYTVTGTDAATGCENTATVDVTVNDAPTVTATADFTEVCEGEMVTLTGGGAATYTWDGGVTDGVAFTPPLGTTTYTVTGSTGSGCEGTATIEITVNALPTVTASADDTNVCEGDEVTLTGGGAATYTWDGGVTDGVPFTPPLGTTTYTVTGTDGSGCEGTATIDIEVETAPAVTASADDTEICEGETVTLTGAGADTYVWDGGVTDGVAFTPAGTGTIDYTVTGTDATSGCTGTATISITVNETPAVGASATSTEVCLGESVTLTGTGADTYVWDGGITDGVAFTPASEGTTTYTVTGTSAAGCSATATITISVIDCEPVVPAFSLTSPVCVGDCITITDQSTGAVASWDWDFGGAADPTTSTDQHPTICLTTAGTFTIQLTTTSSTGTVSSISESLTVNDNPTLVATEDTIVDLGDAAILVASTTSSGTFSWSPDRTVDCPDCPITSADPAENTTYTVTLTDENGCTASDSVMVLVNFIEGVGVPTAFSPNGDGNNDILYVKGYALESISFTVYNRYGQVVFETSDQNIGWDGTFQNQEENPGVFTWVLHYEFLNGKSGMQKGNTTLIRQLYPLSLFDLTFIYAIVVV